MTRRRSGQSSRDLPIFVSPRDRLPRAWARVPATANRPRELCVRGRRCDTLTGVWRVSAQVEVRPL